METQGAKPEEVQGYLDTLKNTSHETKPVTELPDSKPAEKWSTSDKHYIPQLGDAVLGKPDLENPNVVAAAVRPILNLPTSLARGLEDTAKIIPNAYDLAKNQGVGGLARGAGEIAYNMAAGPILKSAGQAIAGGIGAVGNSVFGKNIANPDEQASFNSVKNFVTHPLDSATAVAKGVYDISQENPMYIPLALQSAGKALNKVGVKNIGPIETNDVISSVAHPVIEGTKAGVKALAKPIIKPLQDAAFNKRVGELEKVLNPSKGLAAQEAKYEKNSPKFAAELEREGVKFEFGRDERGRLDTTQAQESVGAIAERDNATLGRLLESSGVNIDLDDAANAARAAIKRTYKGTAQDVALKYIDDELSAYKTQYGSQGFTGSNGHFNLPGKIANEVKQDLWSKSKFPPFGTPVDQARAGSSFLAGHSMKEAIELAVGDDNIVGRLNQRLGDIASLQKMLQKSQGGAIHGGFMGRMFSRVVGSVAGSAGGPVGSITGAITGDMVSEALSNPNRPLSWSKAILGRAQTEQPQLLKEVEARIGRNAQEILERKLLSAPAEPGTATNPIQLPGATPPQSGVIEPTRPGGLYEWNQNKIASQKAAGTYDPRGTYNKGQFLPKAKPVNPGTAIDKIGAEKINMSDIPATEISKGPSVSELVANFKKEAMAQMQYSKDAAGIKLLDSIDLSGVKNFAELEKLVGDIKNPNINNWLKTTKMLFDNYITEGGKDLIINDDAPFNTRAKSLAGGFSEKEKFGNKVADVVKDNIKYPKAGLSTRDITKLHPEDHDLLVRGFEAYRDGTALPGKDELALNRLLDHIGINTNQSVGKVKTQMLAVLEGKKGFKGTDLRNLTGPKTNFGKTQTASVADAVPKKTVFGRK